MLCFYKNKSTQTQVVRFTQTGNKLCDRIIRPKEHVLFEAEPQAVLEIHQLTANHTLLLKTFPCRDLKVSNELIETMLQWLA